jgi:hypothetical protein
MSFMSHSKIKLSFDQNSIIIYHTFNSNFKSHTNFERILKRHESFFNITLTKTRTPYE